MIEMWLIVLLSILCTILLGLVCILVIQNKNLIKELRSSILYSTPKGDYYED